MRFIYTSVLAVSLMAAAPMQAYAQAGPAVSFGQKIAEKVLTSILGAAAGKAFSAIFGSGPHQLTIQDLDNALTNAFDNAVVKNVGS